ncbi:hypothetical protein [Morganella morganii]|uniref:hypothetical protein n=1 Tax=Morganella morganii TaxID=582 RepID=UPI001BDACB03|nr:hypothetical protein [Morganella morganii]MBT0384036.1 hypothetical protein [Morganella morganii subsp. morganii]
MITIDKIRTEDNLQKICEYQYDAFFYGTDIDDRTEAVINGVSINPRYKLSFSKDNYQFSINGREYQLIYLRDFFRDKKYRSILIDSTSLDFPEILYFLNAIGYSLYNINIKIIYVEPLEYNNIIDDDQEECFQLSEKMHPFSALPLFAVNMQSNSSLKTVLTPFLGFENSRLGQIIINDDSATFKKITACVSVPGYISGWENISLKKHLKYFKTIQSELKLYPGSNPYAVTELLKELYEHHGRIIITSLGTKPTAIGISVFLVNMVKYNTLDKFVGAIYDFPIKTKGRSRGIGLIHTYKLTMRVS